MLEHNFFCADCFLFYFIWFKILFEKGFGKENRKNKKRKTHPRTQAEASPPGCFSLGPAWRARKRLLLPLPSHRWWSGPALLSLTHGTHQAALSSFLSPWTSRTRPGANRTSQPWFRWDLMPSPTNRPSIKPLDFSVTIHLHLSRQIRALATSAASLDLADSLDPTAAAASPLFSLSGPTKGIGEIAVSSSSAWCFSLVL